MKKILFIGLLAASVSVQADWYFRGTPNDWATTAMENITENIYQTCQRFGADNPRFKIDRYGDWSQNFPLTGDVPVPANSSQQITWNSATQNLSMAQMAECDTVVVEDHWFYRGTSNNWAATAMESSDNIHFCTQQTFANVAPRFKIDHYGDWSENYPTADYVVEGNNSYTICFNAQSKQITTELLVVDDTEAPIVSVSTAAGTYDASQQISLSVTDNQDAAPQLYCTTDGSMPTSQSLNCNNEIFTAENITDSGFDLVLTVLAVDASQNSAISTYNYTINAADPEQFTVIYYQNSANHSAPNLHYWNVLPSMTATAWPGEALESLGDGWYKYDFSQQVETAQVIFNGSAGQTADLSFSALTPCYQNNNWVTMVQCDITDKNAPVISASPAAGSYEQSNLTIVLTATDRDPNAAIYYTLDGTVPTTNSSRYTQAISIADIEDGGVDALIKVMAIDTELNQSTVAEFAYSLNEDSSAPVVTATPPSGHSEQQLLLH